MLEFLKIIFENRVISMFREHFTLSEFQIHTRYQALLENLMK